MNQVSDQTAFLHVQPEFYDVHHVVKCEVKAGNTWSLRGRAKNVQLNVASATLGQRIHPAENGTISQPGPDLGIFRGGISSFPAGWLVPLADDELEIDFAFRWKYVIGQSPGVHVSLIPAYVEHRLHVTLEQTERGLIYSMVPKAWIATGDPRFLGALESPYSLYPRAAILHDDYGELRALTITRKPLAEGFALLVEEQLTIPGVGLHDVPSLERVRVAV